MTVDIMAENGTKKKSNRILNKSRKKWKNRKSNIRLFIRRNIRTITFKNRKYGF